MVKRIRNPSPARWGKWPCLIQCAPRLCFRSAGPPSRSCQFTHSDDPIITRLTGEPKATSSPPGYEAAGNHRTHRDPLGSAPEAIARPWVPLSNDSRRKLPVPTAAAGGGRPPLRGTKPEELPEDVAALLEGPMEPARLETIRRFGDAVRTATRGGHRLMFHESVMFDHCK